MNSPHEMAFRAIEPGTAGVSIVRVGAMIELSDAD